MNTLKVICIDDSNRPNEVPLCRWVKKGVFYAITEITKMNQQRIYGCKLAEINNNDLFPYQFFALNRFAEVKNAVVTDLQESDLQPA